MKISIDISHVSGDSNTTHNVQGAIEAKQDEECAPIGSALYFLQRNDHEGSSVSGTFEFEDATELYHVLNLIRNNPLPVLADEDGDFAAHEYGFQENPRQKGDDDGVEYGDPRDHRDGLE
jgi:hypothetical protein